MSEFTMTEKEQNARASALINAAFGSLFGKRKTKRPATQVVLREGLRWKIKRSSKYGYYMEASMHGKAGYWPTMQSLREFCAENGWQIESSNKKKALP